MSRRTLIGAIGASVILLPGGHLAAQEGAQKDTGQDRMLEAIHSELRLVRDENQQMREEIDLLRAESDENWMTEQRAEAIRGLVSDVLADADTRAALAGDGLMAGWSDGFFLASADGRFLLNIGSLIQNRFIIDHRSDVEGAATDDDRWRYGFETTTARMNLSGHLFGPDIDYRFSMGYGRLDPHHFTADDEQFGTRIYEAWVRQRLTDEFAVKIGLFKIPFTRESLIYEGRQLLVDRSLIDWRLGLGRTMGIELEYVDDHIRGLLSYNSGSGALFTRINEKPTPPWAWSQNGMEYSFQGRLEFLMAGEWSQFKQFTSPPGQEFGWMIGIAGGGIKGERTGSDTTPTKPELWSATADVSFMLGGASVFASFIYQNSNYLATSLPQVDWYGMVAQGSVYVDQKTEIFARYEWGGPVKVEQNGDGFPTELVSIVMAGFNYYIDGQDVKWTVDGGFAFNPISGIMSINQTGWREEPVQHNAQFLIRTQLQLMF